VRHAVLYAGNGDLRNYPGVQPDRAALPDTSLNGISGTWNPDTISTAIAGTFSYLFTPDASEECAVETTIFVEIVTEIVPVFNPIGPLCQNTVPPALPDTSLNGITGTWNPDTISTAIAGNFSYLFTPDASEECAVEALIMVEIVTEVVPVFEPIGPLCENAVPPILPAISVNGIDGTWEPAIISTSDPGTFSYLFTPDESEECAVEALILVEIVTEAVPVFNPVGPLCQNSVPPALPGISINGISGTWNPDTISTAITGIFSYQFTPDASEECAVDTLILVEIVTELAPVFDPVGTLCQNSEAPELPGTSVNGITGTWEPPAVNTSVPATVTYTFTPDPGQCAVVATMDITVTANPVVSETIVTDESDGQGNGSIEIIATGMTPQLSYTIDNGTTWQVNNGLFEGLSAGIYYCIVMDGNGCDTSFVIIIQNIVLVPLEAITGPDSLCLGKVSAVPVRVNKFMNVATFQLKLNYNVDKLTCIGYTNPHPALASDLTGFVNTAAGEITLNWSSGTPVSFPGLEEVCELVFDTKEPGAGQLEWYTTAADSYFLDPAGNLINAEFYAGQVEIYDPPVILLAEEVIVCEGQPVNIIPVAYGVNAPLAYEWTYPSGLVTTIDPHFDSVTMADAGIYTLKVTDAKGCTDQKAIQLIVSENPVALFHGSDTLSVISGYVLDAGEGMASYLWNTGESTHEITISLEGLYWVEMISVADCYGIDSVFIKIPTECIYIPNAFTPDGDGLNETFRAYSRCPISYYQMLIYNRWGEQLFESHDISVGWDGTKNGKLCPSDAYVYVITYKAEESLGSESSKVEYGVFVLLK